MPSVEVRTVPLNADSVAVHRLFPYTIILIAVFPKFEVRVVQVMASVEVRKVPSCPPAIHKLFP